MSKTNLKKISALIPKDLLSRAMEAAELNQTDTLICALKEFLAKQERLKSLRSLKKFHFNYDVNKVRERKNL
jgi:hypothetical protein